MKNLYLKSHRLLIAALLFIPMVFVAQVITAQTYDPGDIAVINNIIENNGLDWAKAPEDGSYVPRGWKIFMGRRTYY